MYSTIDSKSYSAVADWISHGRATNALEFRPILYPLLLVILSKIGGAYTIFIFQSGLWFLTVNLAGYSLLKSTKKLTWGLIGGGVILSNFTLIALTEHALTEVITTFFLAVLVAFVVKFRHRYKELFFIHGCIFLMASLSIIKPVFSIPFYFLLLLLFFHAAKYLKAPVKIFYLILALMPFLIQMAVIKSEYGKFGISTVGSLAFEQYLFAQGIQHLEKVSRQEALETSSSLSNSKKVQYVADNPEMYLSLFLENLHDNVKASAPFLNGTNGTVKNRLQRFMVFMNRIYYKVHLAFIPITLFMLIFLYKRKEFRDLVIISSLYLLGLYLILVTGISFWQGDRLVLPTIALWAFLYPYLAHLILDKFNNFSFISGNDEKKFS